MAELNIQAFKSVSISGGTNIIATSTNDTVLRSLIIPGTYVGTVTFYDSATVAGTSSTNQLISIGNPTTSIPQVLSLNFKCFNGLTYNAAGTPVVTFTWGY